MTPVTIEGDCFARDGAPLQIISGAIHYFRVVPDYWEGRLRKLKACGFNTVETYMPWNLHEPLPGRFSFDGILDVERFVRLAAALDLMVIIRPGPYICAEWEFGGLPAWLLADPAMQLRCAYEPYLKAVDRYLDAAMERLVPLQASRGGPVVAMQVENEYGSYGNDKAYLRHVADGMVRRGFEGLLFTSDGPADWMLTGGTLPGILKVANFGSDPKGAFAKLREHQPTGPMMCGEFWVGWFDHWGEEHHTRDPKEPAAALDEMLSAGASLNVFMFHGGTSFGFMNGANCGEKYEPTVGSYDYDSLLDEAGDPTPKYHAFREAIAKHVDLPDDPVPLPAPKAAYGSVALTECAPLFANLTALSAPIERPTPIPMEFIGQSTGFILYRTTVMGPREPMPLVLMDVHDRAQVFVDGEPRGTICRNGPQEEVILGFAPGEHRLDVLVENMGRTNYGPHLADRKGITHGVRLGGHYGAFLFGWTLFPLPLDDLSRLEFAPIGSLTGPAFFRGVFAVNEPLDTFVALPGFTKGVVWVNGFNLGRYWEVGPQRTLYLPAPLLRRGENEVIVLELHGMTAPAIELRDQPDLG